MGSSQRPQETWQPPRLIAAKGAWRRDQPLAYADPVPEDPAVKLQVVYDKVLRAVCPGKLRPAGQVQLLLVALKDDAFGADLPDVVCFSPVVNRRVAEELAAGRRVVVVDGHARFEEGDAVSGSP